MAALGSAPGLVTRQSPRAAATSPRGATVALDVAESPRWRTLTTFSGVDTGSSVPFRILGKRWRVSYSMEYQHTCLLLVVCFGPSAEAHNLRPVRTSAALNLAKANPKHISSTQARVISLEVSGGHDSARWTMTVEDYY